jgi:nucleoside-diphosphate-sugar epimerase
VDRYPRAGANLAAEANANRFTAAGGMGVVLRFGWLYGPGATHSEQLLALARRHLGAVLGRPEGYVSSIHAADGARAVAAALEVAAGTFNVVDDEPLTKQDYAERWVRPCGLRVPSRVGLLAGDRLTSLTRSLRVSNARFRSATRWAPRHPSARQGWIATAQLLHHRASG